SEPCASASRPRWRPKESRRRCRPRRTTLEHKNMDSASIRAVAALVLAAVSASCSQNVERTMVPSPIVMQDTRLDFSRAVAPERPRTEVSVLFMTTRAPAPPGAPERYSRRAGDAVRLGVARVQLGEPGWSYAELVGSDRTSRPETPRPARVVAADEFGIFGAS